MLVTRFEAVRPLELTLDLPDLDRIGKAFETVLADRCELEQAIDQTSRAARDDNTIGARQILQPCREIGRFAGDGLIALEVADHHLARGDADTRLQSEIVDWPQSIDLLDDLQRHPDGPLRTVLIGDRIAEADDHAVAEIDASIDTALAGMDEEDAENGLLLRSAESHRSALVRDLQGSEDVELHFLILPVRAALQGPAARSRSAHDEKSTSRRCAMALASSSTASTLAASMRNGPVSTGVARSGAVPSRRYSASSSTGVWPWRYAR